VHYDPFFNCWVRGGSPTRPEAIPEDVFDRLEGGQLCEFYRRYATKEEAMADLNRALTGKPAEEGEVITLDQVQPGDFVRVRIEHHGTDFCDSYEGEVLRVESTYIVFKGGHAALSAYRSTSYVHATTTITRLRKSPTVLTREDLLDPKKVPILSVLTLRLADGTTIESAPLYQRFEDRFGFMLFVGERRLALKGLAETGHVLVSLPK
jgi:hypothetical protein